MAPDNIHEISRALGSIEGKIVGLEGKIGDLRGDVQARYSENRLDAVQATNARQRLYERLEEDKKDLSRRLNAVEQSIAELQNDLTDMKPTVADLNRIRQHAEGAGWAAGRIAALVYAAGGMLLAGIVWLASHLLPLWKGP